MNSSEEKLRAAVQQMRLRKASWPMGRLLRADSVKPESMPNDQWHQLLMVAWLDEAQNLLVLGAGSSDRTHFAESLAKTWFLAGRNVLLASFPQVVDRLEYAKDRGILNRMFKLLDRYEVIVIDELVLWHSNADGRTALFGELLARRAGRRSIVITSGIPPYLWQMNEEIERFVEGSTFAELKRTCQRNQIRRKNSSPEQKVDTL